MSRQPAGERRQRILEAAARVVETEGARHLTMDAVARAAAVSKGGLLYHFPSKRDLLEGMLGRLIEQIEAGRATLRDQQRQTANPALIAWILAERQQTPSERTIGRALLAAAAEDPELLAAARPVMRSAFAEAGASITPAALGWVVLLATEGLRLLDMLDLLPLSAAELTAVQEQLLLLADETTDGQANGQPS